MKGHRQQAEKPLGMRFVETIIGSDQFWSFSGLIAAFCNAHHCSVVKKNEKLLLSDGKFRKPSSLKLSPDCHQSRNKKSLLFFK